jgi:hypothetical protein
MSLKLTRGAVMMNWQFKLVFGGLCAFLCASAEAQFPGGGPPSPDRFFGFLDRNQDGRIDSSEARNMPGSFRDAMAQAGLDLSRGISRDDFARVMPQIFESMRRSREESGSRGDFGRSDRDDRDRDSSRDDRGRDDRDRDRGDSSRREDSRSSSSSAPPPTSSSSSSSSRSSRPTQLTFTGRGYGTPAGGRTKPRITASLPSSWQPLDLNGDGQIGLYEWDRSRFAEFLQYDLNSDGLLTASEIAATKASPPPGFVPQQIPGAAPAAGTPAPSTQPASTVSVSASAVSNTAKPVAPAASVPSGKPLAPVAVNLESSEGRYARYVFQRLDRNRDGSLTSDEWEQSQSIRQGFEKFSTPLTLPADFDRFAGLYVAVQQAEKAKK